MQPVEKLELAAGFDDVLALLGDSRLHLVPVRV